MKSTVGERFAKNAPEAARRSMNLAAMFFDRFGITVGAKPEDN